MTTTPTTGTNPADTTAPARVLPLPQTDAEGERFTFGLLYDIAKVLEEHGYPHLTGRDFTELMVTMWRLLYGSVDQTAPPADVPAPELAVDESCEQYQDDEYDDRQQVEQDATDPDWRELVSCPGTGATLAEPGGFYDVHPAQDHQTRARHCAHHLSPADAARAAAPLNRTHDQDTKTGDPR
jgi:hypothetical protein